MLLFRQPPSIAHAFIKPTVSRISSTLEQILLPKGQPELLPEQYPPRHKSQRPKWRLSPQDVNGCGRTGQATENLRRDGLYPISKLLQHPLLTHLSISDLESVIRKDPRFQLFYRPASSSRNPIPEGWWIRPNKEYVQRPDLRMERITESVTIPKVVYVTTHDEWDHIRRIGIPCRDKEQYIRFYDGLPGPEVLRPPPTPAHPNPENPDPEGKVLIFVDVKRSMEKGIKFYRSKQSGITLLSPGNDNGVIPPDCFRRAQKIAIVRKVVFQVGDKDGELETAEKLSEVKEMERKRSRETQRTQGKETQRKGWKKRGRPKERRASPYSPLMHAPVKQGVAE
ncbi:hypothetical protein BKA70DRAFT_1525357 [Coprinopsis sp. MPI-PUGE-AT-0042]|nr:hypothetical protein BKA70DRAFT_1525357 [Coprinopsis sp. MPI-PUGE-AT-0042]